MPSISLIYSHNLDPTEVLNVSESALNGILVDKFGAKNLTIEKCISGKIEFDFYLGGTFITGNIKAFSHYINIKLKVPLLVSMYKNRIISELDSYIPKYFGTQE
jgi:hypothetical protein